ELALRRGADAGPRGVDLAPAGDRRDLDGPEPAIGVIGEPAQLAAHQDRAAALGDLARRGLPHHAGAAARILEALDQRLDDGLSGGARAAVPLERTREYLHHRDAEIEALDALSRPVG